MPVFPRVKEVRAYIVEAQKTGDAAQGADCHDVADEHWINGNDPSTGRTPIANPMSAYSQYAGARKSWGINALGGLVVEVEADDGTCGVGVTIGGEAGCIIIEAHLSRFVEGRDPRDVEGIWDQMFRATLNYGRKGLALQCISAVDLALWDLLGKLRGEPVYALLGGKTKARLPVYCTTARPDLAKDFGFVAAKVPCPYGPSAGDAGLRKNVEFFKKWREQVGPDFPLALDCYMALTVPYAIKLALALRSYNLKWLEEPLPPDDYEGLVEIKEGLRGTGILLTSGEHEYARYGFRKLLADKAVDVLQPDMTWLGGLTEARRIVAMAAARDVLVVPHGSSVFSYHLQYAFANCPVAEFLNLSPKGDALVPYFGALFQDEPLPKEGFIDLDPTKPGFGVTLVRDGLVRPHARSAEAALAQYCANVAHEAEPSPPAHLPF
ncbi:enolase C-terminal domain-like protein [Pelagophyceae sp. CCMP2097]|nr:enolase C-terminal domain-like protein [Pelagophyceae sp. CCMP2097]